MVVREILYVKLRRNIPINYRKVPILYWKQVLGFLKVFHNQEETDYTATIVVGRTDPCFEKLLPFKSGKFHHGDGIFVYIAGKKMIF